VHILQDHGTIGSPANRRRHPRHATRWWGELKIAGQQFECYVYDVSLGGAKLLVFGSFAPELRAQLFIPPFGGIGCTVRWAESTFIGVKFDENEHERSAELVAQALRGRVFEELPPLASVLG
jgi:hypothetical protein